MLVIASDAHRTHDAPEIHNGALSRSAECPERADMIAEALASAGHEFVEPRSVDSGLFGLLDSVHTPGYASFLETTWPRWVERGETATAAMGLAWPTRGVPGERPDDLVGQLGYHSFGSDTTIVEGTWSASVAAAAIAMTAADHAASTGAAAYGLCRPPGHHAMPDQFGGYCYLNNAAVAAQRLRNRGADRVAILDVDYHHGNGTQAIFYDRDDVLFVSIHGDPATEFPWFSGRVGESGLGSGEGWNVNLPLARGADFDQWSQALDVALAAIASGAVDALVVSLGVDTYEHDPLGTFSLSRSNFSRIGERIATLGLSTVLVQEGGYAVEDLGYNVAAFLDPLG